MLSVEDWQWRWVSPNDNLRQPPARAASLLLLLLLLRACGRLTHYLQTHYILNTHYIVNPQALNNRNVFNRAVLPVCRLFMCQYSGCFDKHMKNTILSQVLKIFLKSTIFALWPKMRFEMKLDTFLDKKKLCIILQPLVNTGVLSLKHVLPIFFFFRKIIRFLWILVQREAMGPNSGWILIAGFDFYFPNKFHL